MSFDWSACAERQQVGGASRKQVLLALASRADASGYCWPSYADISERTELSRSTVIRALEDLQLDGFVTVEPAWRQTKTGEWERDTNGYQLHLDWSLMARPPHLDGETPGNKRGVRVTPGVVSPRHQGGVTVTPEAVKEPGTGSFGTETAAPQRLAHRQRQPKVPSRGMRQVEPDETPSDDDGPVLGAPGGRSERQRPAKREPVGRTPALPERRDPDSPLSGVAAEPTTPHHVALRFKALNIAAKRIDPVNIKEFSATLKRWYAEGLELDVMVAMVDLFARRPEAYGPKADIPWRAFINARSKLQEDAMKVAKAADPTSRYGSAYQRAAQR